MLSELPKLLDRNFALGYLLPAALLFAGTLHLLVVFGRLSSATVGSLLASEPWLGAAAAAVVAWLLGLLLLAANRFLVRLAEGYLLPAWLSRPLRRRQRRRFHDLRDRIRSLRTERKGAAASRRIEIERALTTLGTRFAREFPDREELLLPTAFGNILRAFEVYPRELYGAESIVLWPRLLAIASDSQRNLIEQAKAQVDLWVNTGTVALVLLAEYIGLAAFTGNLPTPLLPVGAVLALLVARWAVRYTALAWGSAVKTTFDVYLPELRAKLGLPRPTSRTQERALWTGFSQAALFRLHQPLPEPGPADGKQEPSGSEEG